MRWSRGKWVWFWSSWGSLGLKDTNTFPPACSTWFTRVPPSSGQRAALLHGTHASGRECDTWCQPRLPKNVQSLLLFEMLMDSSLAFLERCNMCKKKKDFGPDDPVRSHPLYRCAGKKIWCIYWRFKGICFVHSSYLYHIFLILYQGELKKHKQN